MKLFKFSTIIYLSILSVHISIEAQTYQTGLPLRFFKSYEDFLSNTPIPDYEIVQRKHKLIIVSPKKIDKTQYGYDPLNFQKLTISHQGVEKKLKPEQYPSLLLTDRRGVLHRIFDKRSFVLFVHGHYCHYLSPFLSWIVIDETTKKINIFRNLENNFSPDYFSLGITGEIKVFKYEDIEKDLIKFGLTETYKNLHPRLEMFTPNDYNAQKCFAKMEIFRLLNEKLENN